MTQSRFSCNGAERSTHRGSAGQRASSILICLLALTACSNARLDNVAAHRPNADGQWRCESSLDKRWRCIDRSQALTIVITEPPVHSPLIAARTTEQAGEQPARSRAPVTKPLAATALASQQRSPLDYPANHFAVQLLAAKDPLTISRYRQQHPQLVTRQLSINQRGQSWHLLILGIYPSYTAAQQAVSNTPDLLNPAWIRPLGPLQQLLQITGR